MRFAVAAGVLAAGSIVSLALLVRLAQRARRNGQVRDRFLRSIAAAPSGAEGVAAPVRLAAPGRMEATLRSALLAAAIPGDPSSWWDGWRCVLIVAVVLGGLVGGAGLALVAAAAATGLPMLVLAGLRGRGEARLDASLVGLLEAIARSLRAGSSLRQAATAASDVDGLLAEELAEIMWMVDRGADFSEQLRSWAQSRRPPGLPLAVAALSLAAEAGGAQARAVDAVAATLRSRQALRAEQSALASQARASALVMGLTPAAFAVLAGATDPRTARFLLHGETGLACLMAGLVLDGAALVWMLRITGGEP